MLVCQFVTKAVCSCVIDWQTVLAQYPQGHTGYCYTVTFLFFIYIYFFFEMLLSFSEAERGGEKESSHWFDVSEADTLKSC